MTATLPPWAEYLMVFDTETTGVDTSEARIVSAAVALLNPAGEVTERYDWLIDPGVEIPEGAARVHGITTEVARASGVNAAVGVAQITDRIREFIARGFPVVAYNAPFDLSLLKAECDRYGVAWLNEDFSVIDPLVLDKQCDRYRKGKRTLEVTAAHYGVALSAAHDAGADAIAAGLVAQSLARAYGASLPQDASDLHQLQIKWAAAQAANFQDYMRRSNPSFVANGEWPVRNHG